MTENNYLPGNMSVLCHQDDHITNDIWQGNERILWPRRHSIWILKHIDQVDPRIRNLIDLVGFGHILKVDNMEINHILVTKLCEKWRIETHTFHMPLGETTVTLEDVSLQLGVLIDGEPVTRSTYGNLMEFCHELLGIFHLKICSYVTESSCHGWILDFGNNQLTPTMAQLNSMQVLISSY